MKCDKKDIVKDSKKATAFTSKPGEALSDFIAERTTLCGVPAIDEAVREAETQGEHATRVL